jgi:hypothetical protein
MAPETESDLRKEQSPEGGSSGALPGRNRPGRLTWADRWSPARWKRRNAMSGCVRGLATPRFFSLLKNGPVSRKRWRARECSGGLPSITPPERVERPVRAGSVVEPGASRCLSGAQNGGEQRGQSPGGGGSLREERLAGYLLQAARREREDRVAAERQAGSVRAKRTLLSLPRL